MSAEREVTRFFGMPYVPGVANGWLRRTVAEAADDSILLLDPQSTAQISRPPAGLLVLEGAPFSHSMIRLRGLGVPTVFVDAAQAARLVPGSRLWLDGERGEVATGSPPPARPKPPAPANRPLRSADGCEVRLRASVWTPAQASRARQAGAEGIGLVRTEFLLPPKGRMPERDFYIQAFGELCQAASPLPVQVRLLDLAADKLPSWLGGRRPDGGALGMQGARLFALPEVRRVLDAQLAALDLLAAKFELGLMLPYLSRAEELDHWAAYVRARLSRPLPVGAMAESPAGALDLKEWLRVADFATIGCNDLMQCLFAADRDLPALRGFLDPWSPVLYRFLRQVAMAAGARAGEIQLCGLLAQLPGVLPILLGLGFRTFSVDAGLIPWLAQRVQAIRIADAETLAASVCAARGSEGVTGLLGARSSP